ncbi:MAG TPA: ABC transporter permease [Casimicrobiaceae bacterium]|nr:ABC transporter permease [Casimicrobiaceae bacterium]
MLRLLLRRAGHGVLIVWLVATATFFLLHLAPGDPIAASLDSPLTPPAVRAHYRHLYGLDRPLSAQYGHWLVMVAHGDFGFSFPHRRPVSAVIGSALPNTLLLMGVALVLAFAAGIALGLIQARHRGRPLDWGLGIGSLFFYSMPDFWLALMLLFLFAFVWRVFPVTGMFDPIMYPYYGFWQRIGDRLWHLVLPASTLALLSAAAIARFQRAALLDVAGEDFVLTARAKGVSERRVLLHHILRNALLPVITLFGLALPVLLGGSVFVEKIFSWPGMGLLTVEAIGTRDYPLLTAAVVIASVLVIAGSFIADALYAIVDPRVRLE